MKYTNLIQSCLATTLLLSANVTHAHATFEKKSVPAGSYQRLALGIPHGCGKQPTTEVIIEIPEGVISVKPQPKPGWDLQTEIAPYKKSAKKHGKTITEGVKKITWSGGKLPTNFFDEFKMSVKLPPTTNTTLYFVVTQKCGADEMVWKDIPEQGKSSHDYRRPAPSIKLIDAQKHH
ncbi:MAG: YcnI family protein [Gammaproteobacteria bacterium]|nr:YcnI family protein [Gammaproteobacteria bacterium]